MSLIDVDWPLVSMSMTLGAMPRRRTPDRIYHVLPADVVRIASDPEVGKGGADAGAAQHLDTERCSAGKTCFHAGHLHREECRVDSGQHRDVLDSDPRIAPRGDDVDRQPGECVTVGGPHGNGPGAAQRTGGHRDRIGAALGGPDDLLEAPLVVGEEVAGGAHDRRRTPVVDFQWMVGGTRK